MSITDELREYALSFKNSHDAWSSIGEKLDHIADCIDVAHEEALVSSYLDGVFSDGGLAEYVRLPVDVDGETIHIGDEMVLQHEAAEKPYTVQSLTWDGEDWYFTCDEGFFNACGWMHHRAPTVEDVLVKMLEKAVGYSDAHTTVALNAIAEYAAKLRLASNEE